MKVSEWQPIETAPHGEEVIIAGIYPNGISYVETSWKTPKGSWNGRKLDPPTHWMSLPDPPQAASLAKEQESR
jgi:hypothetical protein